MVAAREGVDSRYLEAVVVVAMVAVAVDTGYLVVVVVAASLLDYSGVVAQGSPLVTRLSTFITLGEMRNMREVTTVSDRWQQTSSK